MQKKTILVASVLLAYASVNFTMHVGYLNPRASESESAKLYDSLTDGVIPECGVCLQNCNDINGPVTPLPCRRDHWLHTACLQELKQSNCPKKCLACQADLPLSFSEKIINSLANHWVGQGVQLSFLGLAALVQMYEDELKAYE